MFYDLFIFIGNVDLHSDTPSQGKQTADNDNNEENVVSKEESNLTKIKEKDGVVMEEEQLNEPLVIPVEVEEKTNENPIIIPNLEKNKIPIESPDDAILVNSEMESTETEIIIQTEKISNLVVSSENVTMEIITDIEFPKIPQTRGRGRKRTKNNSNNEDIIAAETDANLTDPDRDPALETNR